MTWLESCDKTFTHMAQKWSLPILRVSLGTVFLWFGMLKMMNVSPVVDLVRATYAFIPTEEFVFVLGVWEVIIGIGLILHRMPRTTLMLLFLQMGGTFMAPLLNPSLFFLHGNIFLLTLLGEFVFKNVVLISAGLVLWGHNQKNSERPL